MKFVIIYSVKKAIDEYQLDVGSNPMVGGPVHSETRLDFYIKILSCHTVTGFVSNSYGYCSGNNEICVRNSNAWQFAKRSSFPTFHVIQVINTPNSCTCHLAIPGGRTNTLFILSLIRLKQDLYFKQEVENLITVVVNRLLSVSRRTHKSWHCPTRLSSLPLTGEMA